MENASQAALRVALLGEDYQRGEFRALLEDEGIQVVLDARFDLPLPDAWNGAEVLLVDMDESPERSDIADVLEQSPVPVLLNAGGVGTSLTWHRRLVGKLQGLARRSVAGTRVSAVRPRPELTLVHDQDAAADGPWLVVLGASIGGPKAVARFLRALPVDLPVSFLLAQHISEAFQGLLVEQLDRSSGWPVGILGDTETIEPGQVWLVPSQVRIELEGRHTLKRLDEGWQSVQKPDIDAVLQSVAHAFGPRSGAILFSGLGKDGSGACNAISQNGGFVWAQSAESCVISNMPEAARRRCSVEFSGSPEQLAEALLARCQSEAVRPN